MKEVLTVQSDYRKAQIPVDDIMYITVEGRKTKITRSEGNPVLTNKSLKDVFADLPEETFSNINRGIVVSKRYIKDEKNGIITMTDGVKFRRRVRSDRAPKPQKKKYVYTDAPHVQCPAPTLGQWLDQLPMPMVIMELVYGKGGTGMDFQIRYCNREMARLEGVEPQAVKECSVSSLPNVGSAKWMAVFADVALSGSSRVIEDALEGSSRYMQLKCFQPQPGFCACILTDLTRENHIIRELFRQE